MFQYPYILYVLIAAAIPVLLHILNLQRVQRMEFSTLMFLKEIRKSRFRKIRIKHLLLMLIRLFIIVFLVIAISEPILSDYPTKDSNKAKYGLIFSDSSFSMSAKQDTSDLYTVVDNISKEIKSTFNSSDEIEQIRTSTNKTNIYPDLNSILNNSNTKIETKNLKTNEVFIISDIQKSNFENLTTNTRYPENTYYDFLNVSKTNPANISLNDVKVLTRIPEQSKQIKIKVIVKNYGENFVPNNKISLITNNEKVDDKYFDINSKERKEIEFSFVPKQNGNLLYNVELATNTTANDEFKEDNKFQFNVYIPEKISIGIVCDNIDSRFIKYVFDAANKYSNEKIFQYSEKRNLDDLSNFDMFYLVDYNLKGESDIQKLKDFLSQGKGVFVFPPDNNAEFYNKLGCFNISKNESLNNNFNFSEINTTNPIFDGLFKNEGINPISEIPVINISQLYNLNTSSNSYPLITLNNLKPLLIEDKSNNGTILFSSVPLNPSASSFNSHTLFAPIILKSSYYLSYFKKIEDMQIAQPINHDTLESNPERISERELESMIEKAGIKKYKIINQNELKDLQEIIAENRRGKSFWNYAIIMTLLLIGLEIIVMRKTKA